MGALLKIKTDMQWPLGQVFEIPDQFNGHQRGTFYFRDSYGDCQGPFHHFAEAQHNLQAHLAEANRV